MRTALSAVLRWLPAHIPELLALPMHHRDPFDRLLIAQARGDLPGRGGIRRSGGEIEPYAREAAGSGVYHEEGGGPPI